MSCVLKELLDKDPDRQVFSLFLKRFEHKQPQCIDRKKDSPRHDATALLRKLESDSEDFSELEADKLWILVCVACFDQALRTVGKGVWFLR